MIKINNSMFILPHRVIAQYPAWIGHIPFASWLIEELKPKTLVELGTHTGNSFLSMCQTVKDLNLDCTCYAVDTWVGDKHAGEYGEDIYLSLKEYQELNYASFSHLKRMLFDDAVKEFKKNSIDLLHIDGLHTYEAVSNDFNTWLPKMSNQGVVLFHDIAVKDRDFGVYQLWDELKGKYPSFTFNHSFGLGVLFVGKQSKHILDSLGSAEDEKNVQVLFTRLGDDIMNRIHLIHLNAQNNR